MKKVIIIASLAILALLSSCTSITEAEVKTSVVTETQTLTIQAVTTTVVNTITVVKVVDPITGNEYTIRQGELGVANADAKATGYFNGYPANWIGLVLNGKDESQVLGVSVTPYYNAEFKDSPPNVADWVTVTNPNLVNGTLTVSPMSAASLYITLNVPKGIQLPDKWGLVVNVVGTSGTIRTGSGIRWLIYMQQPS